MKIFLHYLHIANSKVIQKHKILILHRKTIHILDSGYENQNYFKIIGS